jgi:hypothetical protein
MPGIKTTPAMIPSARDAYHARPEPPLYRTTFKRAGCGPESISETLAASTGSMTKPTGAITSLPRVAAIATMASRLETFRKVLPVIHAQVDHVYLSRRIQDAAGFPAGLRLHQRESRRRCKDLHASSRFLCLRHLATPTVVMTTLSIPGLCPSPGRYAASGGGSGHRSTRPHLHAAPQILRPRRRPLRACA